MGMRMSEARRLAHAGEVAHWAVLLLGWLWLGEQGMRLGWSLASGVLAVVLWWSARLLCRGSAWALRTSPASMAWFGGLSALGVCLPEALASLNLAHAGLCLVALVWGAWTGLVETRSRVSTFDLGPVAWHPVLAAGLVVLAWRVPGGAGSVLAMTLTLTSASWGASVLLALCAAVLWARDVATAELLPECRGPRAGWVSLLPTSAMGLMMGGLWLGNAWCIGLGWSTEEMVFWHLAMMAVLPSLVALAGRTFMSPYKAPAGGALAEAHFHAHSHSHALALALAQRRCQIRNHLILALLVLGALMLWGQSPLHGLLAMLLPSLAWAVHCTRPHTALVFSARTPLWFMRGMALALGPGLLMWVGMASPTQGPMAMQTALVLIAILAAAQALVGWVRPPVAQPTWPAPSSL